MLFYSFFKTLIGRTVTVHLKNDVEITGTLLSTDQFLNIKLSDVKLAEEAKYPHLLALESVFLRGSVVRYVEVPKEAVDTELLQDAARIEYMNPSINVQKPKQKKSVEERLGTEGEEEGIIEQQ